jgi:hypothetical protein
MMGVGSLDRGIQDPVQVDNAESNEGKEGKRGRGQPMEREREQPPPLAILLQTAAGMLRGGMRVNETSPRRCACP